MSEVKVKQRFDILKTNADEIKEEHSLILDSKNQIKLEMMAKNYHRKLEVRS